jgi:hypothetical protein
MDNGLGSAHVEAASAGPKELKSGPVLPNKEIDTEETSVMDKLCSRKEIVSIDVVAFSFRELPIPNII